MYRNLILCNLYKKIVYLVGINKGIILGCTAYQISRPILELGLLFQFHNHVIFYTESLSVTILTPKVEEQVSVFMTPGERKAQVIPLGFG